MRLPLLLAAVCAAYAQPTPAEVYAERTVVTELSASCASALGALVDNHCADNYQATASFETSGLCQGKADADCKEAAFIAVDDLISRGAAPTLYRPNVQNAVVANHAGVATTKYTLNCFTSTLARTPPLSFVAIEQHDQDNNACPYGIIADISLKTTNVSAPLTSFDSVVWAFTHTDTSEVDKYQLYVSILEMLLNTSFSALTFLGVRTDPDIFVSNLETFVVLDDDACYDRLPSVVPTLPVSALNLHLNRTQVVALSLAVVHSISAADLAYVGETDWVVLEWITPNILNADDLPSRAQALCNATHKFANTLPPGCDDACASNVFVASVCDPDNCFPSKGHVALSAYLPPDADMCDLSDVELDALHAITLEGFVTGYVHFRPSSSLTSIAIDGCNMNYTFFENETNLPFLVSLELVDSCDTAIGAPQMFPAEFESLRRLRLKAGSLALNTATKSFNDLAFCDLHNVHFNISRSENVCASSCEFHAPEDDYTAVRCEADDTVFDILSLSHTMCGRNTICCTVDGATDIANSIASVLNFYTDPMANGAQNFSVTSYDELTPFVFSPQLTLSSQLGLQSLQLYQATRIAALGTNPYCVFNELYVDVLNVGTDGGQQPDTPPYLPIHAFLLDSVSTDDYGSHLLFTIDNFLSGTTLSTGVSMIKEISISPMIDDDGINVIGEVTSYTTIFKDNIIPDVSTVMHVVDELFVLFVQPGSGIVPLHCAFLQLMKGHSLRFIGWGQEIDYVSCVNLTTYVEETAAALQSNDELRCLRVYGTAANPVPLPGLFQLPQNNNPRPSKLEVIDLQHVQINSTLDTHFATMYSHLHTISMENCTLTGAVPAFHNTPVVAFKNNPGLTGNLTNILSHTTNYTHIDFSGTGVTGTLLPSMALCSSAIVCKVPGPVVITGCSACSH